MGARTKLTVSVDAALARHLDETSRRRQVSRSRLVEEALTAWQREQVEAALRDGYRAMAAEDRESAEVALAAQWEAIR